MMSSIVTIPNDDSVNADSASKVKGYEGIPVAVRSQKVVASGHCTGRIKSVTA